MLGETRGGGELGQPMDGKGVRSALSGPKRALPGDAPPLVILPKGQWLLSLWFQKQPNQRVLWWVRITGMQKKT